MQSKTFSLNGATITVTTETGRAYIDRMAAEVTLGVYDKESVSNRDAFHRIQFAAVYAQSEIEGHLPFEWPQSPSDREAMRAACEAWLAMPGADVATWIGAVNEVNVTPNDPDLKPPESVEKKDSSSPSS